MTKACQDGARCARLSGLAAALLASTALVAVPAAMAPFGFGSVAFAAGGYGGYTVLNGGFDQATGAGDAGSDATSGSGEGGGGGGAGITGGAGGNGAAVSGGAGGTSPGGSGSDGTDGFQASGGGGGGGGGAHGYVDSVAPSAAVVGGNGGNGGSALAGSLAGGGGGGAGGFGAVLTDSGAYTLGATITGGNGGNGGSGDSDGFGGDGGIGLMLSSPGASVTVSSGTTIQGGSGGLGRTGGAGGAGISGAGVTVTLESGATVAGGYDGSGNTRANAIAFTGGASTLVLQGNGNTSGQTYATITGNVVGSTAVGASNKLELGGAGGVFDLSQLDAGQGNGTQFQNIGAVSANSTGTWIVTSTQAGSTAAAWRVDGGTLQIGDGGISGSVAGDMVNNGILAFNRSDAATYGGAISGTGAVQQIGTGTLILTGTSTYTGGTLISAGMLQVGGGGTSGSIAGAVDNESILAFNRSDALTYGGAVSGSGVLRQDGTGTLTLTGTHSYTGGTVISAGTLQIGDGGTSGSIPGDVTNDGTLAFNRNDAVTFGNVVSGSGALRQNGSGTLILTGANTYTGGTVISAGTLQIGDGNTSGSISGNVLNNGTLAFNRSDAVTYSDAISGSGELRHDGSGTLTLTGSNTYSGATVIATGTLQIGDGNTAGSIAGNVVDNGTLAFNRSDASTYSGAISGSGLLRQDGSGTLTLTGSNTHTGGTTISAGTLQVGSGGTSGSISGDIVNDGTLAFNRSDAVTYGGTVSGNGALRQDGSGTLTLTGTHSYTGDTTVTAGTLQVNGALSSASAVSVLQGGTLGGSGTVGATRVYAGGTIAGQQGQVLTTGDLTLAPGAHVAARLNDNGSSALLNVQGNLVLNGTLDLTSTTGAFGAGLYRIISYTGSLSGSGLTVGTITGSVNVPDVAIQTDTTTNTVNLISNATTASYWNAGQSAGAAPQGGSGTWDAKTRWANAQGTNAAAVQGQATAIFAGTAGTVTVDTSAGAVSIGGLQFVSSGYQVTGGAITLANAQTNMRVGDGTSASAGTTATIASALTGSGGLVKSDYGTLVLTGLNSYTGGTSVTKGTLALGNASALGTGGVSLNEGTTLAFTGDVTLANPLSFPELGDPIIDTGANAVTIASAVSGIGDLSKIGSGTLTLTGQNSYTGATDVVAGTLVVTGSVAASSGLNVETGAVLGGSGTVPNLTALAGSTVAPGVATPFSTLNVAGNVSFAAGSTYRVGINAGGQTDAIVASGTATLSGGTVDVVAGTGTYAASTRYRILTAAGGRSGQFATLSTTTNLAFLSPSLSYDATGVDLALTRTVATDPTSGASSGSSSSSGSNSSPSSGSGSDPGSGVSGTAAPVSFASVARTPNQRAAAAAIESRGKGTLYDAVLSQTAAGARAAFDAASGEVHASALTAGVEDTRLVREAIAGHLDETQRRDRGGAPAVAGSVTSPGLWGMGFGDFGRNGPNGNAAALDRSLGGFVIGADAAVQAQAVGTWRIGLAGGYTNDSLTVRDRASRGSFETYFGGVYAGATYGAFDIKLGLLGGGTQTNTQRNVAFPGFSETARANYGGSLVQSFGEVGYKIALAQGFVEPVFQGAVIHIGQDAYRETGGDSALRSLAHATDVETTVLGLRGEAALPSAWPLFVRGFLGWRHAYGDVDPKALLSFASGGPNFVISGAPIARDAAVMQAGLDYRANQAVTLGIGYTGQAGRRARDNGVKGRMEVSF